MKLFAPIATLFESRIAPPFSPVQPWLAGRAAIQPDNYQAYATEGYAGNSLVFAAIQMLSTSAAEPDLRVRYGTRWTKEHNILRLLNRPNPFMDGAEFWATVVMYRIIAGNAYAVKVRTGIGRPLELWLLRPDRVRIVPDANNFISHYEYLIGAAGETMNLPVPDVIHWKTRNPLDDFYGMSQLKPLGGYIDVDNYMRDFTKAFFQNAGVPGGLLNIKGKLSEDQRTEIRERFKRTYRGASGWHEMMVLDNTEASFTPMTAAMGAQGLVIPELNMINETRIVGGLGVPLSLVGTNVGAGNSSYGNKKSERESFYNETVKPLWRELVSPVNRSLVPDFPGVDEVEFDMSTVGALSGEIDELHARVLKDLNGGLISLDEARDLVGLPPASDGEVFYIPTNLSQTPLGDIGKKPAPVPAQIIPPTNGARPQPVGANA
jgi:HK97 family phage portal protein